MESDGSVWSMQSVFRLFLNHVTVLTRERGWSIPFCVCGYFHWFPICDLTCCPSWVMKPHKPYIDTLVQAEVLVYHMNCHLSAHHHSQNLTKSISDVQMTCLLWKLRTCKVGCPIAKAWPGFDWSHNRASRAKHPWSSSPILYSWPLVLCGGLRL